MHSWRVTCRSPGPSLSELVGTPETSLLVFRLCVVTVLLRCRYAVIELVLLQGEGLADPQLEGEIIIVVGAAGG